LGVSAVGLQPIADRRALNLGCGAKRDSTAVNLDVTPDTEPDVVHNLNQYPWPFADNRFDKVTALDVIEHLDDIAAAMSEIHRICRPGAIVHLTVPHFSSDGAYTDPTHRHYFGAFTFDYFSAEHPLNFYSRARFRNRSTKIIFRPALLNKFIWRLANRYPRAYEQRWTWIFPAWFLAVQLEAVK
jgi:SAM-dependent methyltransferase